MSTERSPLLPTSEMNNGHHHHLLHNNTGGLVASGSHFPPLLPTLAALPESRHLTLPDLHETLQPITTISRAQQNAFVFVALLHLLINSQIAVPLRSETTWQQWNHLQGNNDDTEILLKLLEDAWESFLERAQDDELEGEDAMETLLWHPVPLDASGFSTTRAIDLLAHPLAPTWLLTHPLIMISMNRTWTRGVPCKLSAESSISTRMFSRLDSFSTPRVLYTVALLFHVLYLMSLANLVLAPPTSPIFISPSFVNPVLGTRELGLLLYSGSTLLYFKRSYIVRSIPPLLTLMAIFFAFPHAPTPNTIPHNMLILSLAWSLFQLHLPSPPSPPTPLYILKLEDSLPIATLVQSLMMRTLLPALRFFAPILVTLLVLLTIALADTFPLFNITAWDDALRTTLLSISPITIESSHPQTRLTLIVLFIITLGCYLLFIFSLILIFPTLPDPDTSIKNPWDRYTPTLGLVARRNFIRVLVAYSDPLGFPPPLNVLHLMFIAAPVKFLKVVSRPESAKWWEHHVGAGLWRSTMGVLGFGVAGLYGWKRS